MIKTLKRIIDLLRGIIRFLWEDIISYFFWRLLVGLFRLVFRGLRGLLGIFFSG